MTLHVLVVGGGKVGTALAQVLLDGNHRVTVLDDRPGVLARLRTEIGRGPGSPATVVEGVPTDPAALETAGIRRADVVAAVTAADERNLVVTGLARFHFGVPRTVARIVDPARAWMYAPDMGVDVALDQADLMAHIVAEEMSLGEMMLLAKLRRGQHALVEERLHPDAAVVGLRLADLPLPAGCVVVAVLREGQPVLQQPDLVLRAGDDVVAIVHDDAAAELAALLGPGSARVIGG